MQLKRKVALALLAALSFAAPAFAHVPARELAPAIDLRHARVTAQEPVQPFHIVPGHLFADVAHVEEPAASLSTTLAERFAAENLNHERPHALRLTRAVSQNLTSGLRESLRRAIIREINGLGPETRWAEGYVRERWYDPERGSWLSPDPLGNRDSANLYAYAGGDPVNGRDPTGKVDLDDVWFFTKGVAQDTAEAAVNIATVGIYSGVKRARTRGKIAGVGDAVVAGAEGVTNFASLGYYNSAEDTLNGGGTLVDATKEWLGDVSGVSDVSEGGTKIGEGEYLEGAGKILVGAGKVASIALAAKTVQAHVENRAVRAFGENVGADPPYSREGYGGSRATRNPEANTLRKINRGLPCPDCGTPQVPPWPEHDPELWDHFENHGGKYMTDAEKVEYAKSPAAYNGTRCAHCQRVQGGLASQTVQAINASKAKQLRRAPIAAGTAPWTVKVVADQEKKGQGQ